MSHHGHGHLYGGHVEPIRRYPYVVSQPQPTQVTVNLATDPLILGAIVLGFGALVLAAVFWKKK